MPYFQAFDKYCNWQQLNKNQCQNILQTIKSEGSVSIKNIIVS